MSKQRPFHQLSQPLVIPGATAIGLVLRSQFQFKLGALLVACAFMEGLAMAETINFDASPPGTAPSGWTTGVTGRGASRWTVEPDATAPSKPNVLKQSAVGDFPWCVMNDAQLADGYVEVRFKPIAGKDDQAGGVVWRWKDGDNYYVARANALENNVSLYYTQHGRRNTIKYVNAPVAKNEWHTLRVVFAGKRLRVALDGKVYIDVEDEHIAGGGRVGLWTKADSVTLFDDFTYGTEDRK